MSIGIEDIEDLWADIGADLRMSSLCFTGFLL